MLIFATTPHTAKARKTHYLNLPQASAQSLRKRSLPDLTEIVEFLERIEKAHCLIQRIAIFIYSLVKGINELHLYRIASIRLDLAGRRIW